MDCPPSSPSLPLACRGGTIVGMPALVPPPRADARSREINSTTLRSLYDASEAAPCSDAFHPERWSRPPPSGVAPIYPCDDPEEDDVVRVVTVSSHPPPAEAFAGDDGPASALPRSAPPSEDPPTHRLDQTWPSLSVAPSVAAAAAPAPSSNPPQNATTSSAPPSAVSTAPPLPDEPVFLPMRARGGEAERVLLLSSAGAAVILLVGVVSAALIWL